jgi:hypothetical protein
MSDLLAVVVNGVARIEYDRNVPLPGLQRQFLERMDRDMDTGIMLGPVHVKRPSRLERAQFVANHLINAVLEDRAPVIAAACAYLATRVPELKQVSATGQGEDLLIDLVFDRVYHNQVKVDFPS